MDRLGLTARRIAIEEGDSPSIRIDDLRVATPAGTVMLSEPHLDLKQGERILIAGDQGGGACLFRAIAGLWPWGSGLITFPAHRSIVFRPTQPYVPPGVLRASITYPESADAFKEAVIVKALADVGLERLEPLLGKSDRWDRLLSDDEKHRLAVVRVMLQRPLWVVIHSVLNLIDPASRTQIEAIFTGPLADVGVIHIGNDENESGFFTRTIHLVTDPNGPSFNPAHAVGASDRIQPPPQTLAAQ